MMNLRRIYIVAAVALVVTGWPTGGGRAAAQEYSVGAEAEANVQVLTRGPVHEAFAETVTYDPEPGFEVRKAPPEPIEELPPEQRPEGANVTWIPGYWAWDDERDDFLWVSGVWRALPPGRQWNSGYWARSSAGSRWVSGYWADSAANEIEYLPPPPETIEVGPNIAPPSPDYVWIPGSWIWYEGRYAWRPGYWEEAQSDWVWVPDHYVAAPRGYVFVDGYWDYSVARRGVLFAPVYFQGHDHRRPGYHYSPTTVINLEVALDHLFVRPRYHHYYFGDYYAQGYHDAGFHSRFAYHSHRHGYDPIYVHQRWRHRGDRDWEVHVQADFQKRRDHVEDRPPRSLDAQIRIGGGEAGSRQKNQIVAMSVDQLSSRDTAPLRFQRIEKEERQKLAQRGREVQRFREERRDVETRVEERSPDPDRSSPLRVTRPRSPIVGKQATEISEERVPSRSQRVPRPDTSVQPKRSGGKKDQPKGGSKVKKEKDKDD